jgi:hypothetical protein
MHFCSVVDPKLFLPDPTLTLISDPDSDPDPTLTLILDPDSNPELELACL